MTVPAEALIRLIDATRFRRPGQKRRATARNGLQRHTAMEGGEARRRARGHRRPPPWPWPRCRLEGAVGRPGDHRRRKLIQEVRRLLDDRKEASEGEFFGSRGAARWRFEFGRRRPDAERSSTGLRPDYVWGVILKENPGGGHGRQRSLFARRWTWWRPSRPRSRARGSRGSRPARMTLTVRNMEAGPGGQRCWRSTTTATASRSASTPATCRTWPARSGPRTSSAEFADPALAPQGARPRGSRRPVRPLLPMRV